MLKEYVNFWKRSFDFKGRSRRREYWIPYLWSTSILYVLLAVAVACIFGSIDSTTGTPGGIAFVIGIIFVAIASIYSLLMIVPTVALCVRRCHDVGLSGWICLACILGFFLCGLGGIAWIVISCLDSKEDNQWGPNPKSDEHNQYSGSGSIGLAVGVFMASIVFYIVLVVVGVFSGFMNMNTSGLFKDDYSSEVSSEVPASTEEWEEENVSEDEDDAVDYELEDESNTDDIDTDDIDTEETNSNETTYALIDEETGKPLYRLVNYYYDTTYENGTDMENVIYTFAEPEGYKVDTEYLSDTIGFADTLFFLENEEGDSISLSCSVPGGIIGYYEPDSEDADMTDMENYEVKETGFCTPNNGEFGFDIFEYTYDEDLKMYYAVTYVEPDNSLVVDFPISDNFDDLEEVKTFLTDAF